MDKGAGGYTWRAIVYYIIAAVSLGILTPLMTFRLAKYKNDRSWFGDAKFEQGGQWTKLYAAMKHVFIGVGLLIAGILAATVSPDGRDAKASSMKACVPPAFFSHGGGPPSRRVSKIGCLSA